MLERFIDRASLDTAYFDTPYFLVPDGRAADTAFGVIREAIARQDLVGVSRIVLGSRERAAIIERRGNGMLLTTLRAAHEIRSADPYFSEIDDAPADETMIDMAQRIMAPLAGALRSAARLPRPLPGGAVPFRAGAAQGREAGVAETARAGDRARRQRRARDQRRGDERGAAGGGHPSARAGAARHTPRRRARQILIFTEQPV